MCAGITKGPDMLGIPDFWVWLAYVLCILCTCTAVIYGAINWNKGGQDVATQEMVDWANEEDKIGEEL